MSFFCSRRKIIALIATATAAITLHAQDGWREATLHPPLSYRGNGSVLVSNLAAADFNHDGHPDGAILLRHGHNLEIEVCFRSHRMKSIFFTSDLADVAISAIDVNHDGSPDLVVEHSFSHQRLFVWLNDGTGSFYAASANDYPSSPAGNNPRVTRPLPDKDWSALIESRVRARHADGYLERQAAVVIPNCFKQNSILRLAKAVASPNLVRGSPASLAE